MEYKTTEAEYYRKIARILHNLRYVVLLILLITVVIGFTSFKKELTYENFRYIMRYADFKIGANYSDKSVLNYTADEESIYGYIKGDLAILSPKGFRTYDFSGSELLYEKKTYPNPCMKTAGKYALCYDSAGTELSLYNSYSNVVSKKFEYGIKDAVVRSDGSYAVATSGKYLRSKVTVFEEDGEFSYESRDKEVIAVSLPENSEYVNFIALSVENGDFNFILTTYNTRKKEPILEKKYVGEFPLKLYSDENVICVLTDKALHFTDYDGNTIKSYDVDTEKLSGFYQSGDYIALTYTKSVTGNSTVKIYDKKARQISTDNFENNIIDFSVFDDKIYVLENGKLHIMTVENNENSVGVKSFEVAEIGSEYTDVFAIGKDEYIITSRFGATKISG